MPLKNGWATMDRLLEVNPSLPVLIVTGQPNQDELAEAAGVSALVEKPIDVPALLQLIHKLLRETGRVSNSRAPAIASFHFTSCAQPGTPRATRGGAEYHSSLLTGD